MTIDSVRLGLMPPLTGLVGLYGTEIANAGRVACQEINENGGVLGRELELVIADDGSMPESAVAAAKNLVDQHACTAIIGNLLSNSRIAVAYRVAEPRKIPYLNFSFYEGSILSRYFFHFAALPNQQIDLMIPYMRKQFGPKMFFAGNNYEWPRGSINAAKRTLALVDGVVSGEEYCPIGVGAEAIDALLDRVEAAQPDVFVPYFAGADQVLLLSRFTERGLKQRMTVVMGHYDEMMASQLSPQVREGFYSSNTYFMSVDSPENRAYLSQLARLPGVEGIWPQGNGILTNFGEGTYVCVKAFAQAANQAGSLDSEALVDALKTVTVAAPQGTVRMNPEHHHARVNTYLTRCRLDGSFEIIERFGAVDPVIPDRYSHQSISDKPTREDDIRLQARMLEQMTEGVLLISSSTRTIIYANVSAERIFGYGRAEMVGLPLRPSYIGHGLSMTEGTIDVIDTLERRGEWAGEFEEIRKDGTPMWCAATISTFTHPVHGEVWLGAFRDITDKKRSEVALRQSLREKETLLREVHHRVKNNLQIISSLLHFQMKKMSDPADRAVLREGQDRLRAMVLVHERLYKSDSLSQIEMGEYLRALLEQLRESHGRRVNAITVHYALSECALDAERALPLGMILVELVSNVFKYAFPKDMTGELRIVLERDEGNMRLVVSDNGVGFAVDAMSESSGFGARLVQNLVLQLDGELRITADGGTTATVEFPCSV